LKAEAEARLHELESRMPYVTLKLANGNPADVVIRRDGARVPIEALGHPLPVDPGKHVIVVEAEGRVPRSVTIAIAPGERSEVSVEPGEPRPVLPPSAAVAVGRSPAAAAGVARTPFKAHEMGPASLLLWSGVGLATVGLVTGTVTGLLTLSKSGLRDSCPGGQCPPDVMAEVERARTTGTISTVAFSAAAVGLAAAGVGFYLRLRTNDQRAGASSEVALTPTLGGFDARVTF
jgi:hypothetical protein